MGKLSRRQINENSLKVAKNGRLMRKYGISLEYRDSMSFKQIGLCAICETREAACVDHNHKTGEVRRLLCSQCNSALGMAGDSIVTVLGMLHYLMKHNCKKDIDLMAIIRTIEETAKEVRE